MNKETISALLGRPLTLLEDQNFKLYLSIASSKLEEILCSSIKEDSGVRYFEPRVGMRTVYLDYFTEIEEVKVGGRVVPKSDYTPMLSGDRNTEVYNSIVFKTAPKGDIEVDAFWGFDCPPVDLRQVVAQLFAMSSKRYIAQNNVKSKRNEDFSITFSDNTELEDFVSNNAGTIDKYSLCSLRSGTIISGKTSWVKGPEFPIRQNDFYRGRW